MLATCQFSGDMSALYLPSWILSVHQEIDREYHVHEGGRQGSIVYSWRGIHTLSGAASTMTGLCRILGLSIWVLPLRKTPAEVHLILESPSLQTLAYGKFCVLLFAVDFPKGTRRWGDVAIVQNKAEFRHRGT